MALDKKQTELLTEVQQRLKHGDIKKISNKVGISRENVSKALSITTDYFNEIIVEAALVVILEREERLQKMLDKLATA